MIEENRNEKSSSKQFSNRLINESSPYLLQHAHNPVDWYPWNEEAFARAKKENMPVLVSIGYAACHWCHVMERESFENEETAKFMNEHFINIKVDREERPDVDHIYMDAIQSMTGSGGWPLNVFLTPERKPFFGGTYFPPIKAFNRSSWMEILFAVSEAFNVRRNEIEEQANYLTAHLEKSSEFNIGSKSDLDFSETEIEKAFQIILNLSDRQWGGFGKAPKFPQTFTIQFLLKYYYHTKNKEALDQAVLSLDKMAQGGIYDHIGGGFSRYSTDNEWLVPHFEKMLYDNALLIETYAEAFQLTKKNSYKKIIEETVLFIQEALMNRESGFYSALDADSEGEEGKYYVWTKDELDNILKEDSQLFTSFYDIRENGNWEHKNILRTLIPLEDFANEQNMDYDFIRNKLINGKQKLKKQREKRNKPLLDDKIILGWNALMNKALSKAYAATGNDQYLTMAQSNMDFITKKFLKNGSELSHTWKNEPSQIPAFLDDYAFLISALIELAQASADYNYLNSARQFTEFVIKSFSDEKDELFYYTSKDQKDILLRKKEIYDGAIPSGNSIMAINLHQLSILLHMPAWAQRAQKMIDSIGPLAIKYPSSFAVWLSFLFEVQEGIAEIAIIGKNWKNLLVDILGIFLPYKIVMAGEEENKGLPLLANKKGDEKTLIYLCQNYACEQPVTTIERLISLLSGK